MQQEILDLKEKCLSDYSGWGTVGKLVPESYRDFREYRWKQSWSKRSRNIGLFFLWSRNRHTGSSSWPKPIQMKKIHTPAILEDFLPDHDRTMTDSRPKTHLTDRLSSMSNFLFPIKGSGGSNLRSFSAQKKIETAVMNSVRRNCWKRSLFYTRWMEPVVHGAEWNDEKLQVHGVDQTPYPSLLHGASLATAMQQLCCPLLLVIS